MNAFFRFLALSFAIAPASMAASDDPVIAGAWTELRQAPLFDAAPVSLAKTWGPSLPLGNSFQVEKVYGRWIYGTPAPIARMRPSEYAKPGWIYSRMLLLPGDKDSAFPATVKKTRAMIYHSRNVWKELGLAKDEFFPRLDFLESLVVSERTLKAFQDQDEPLLATTERKLPELIPSALAEEPSPSMGLTGTDLGFLEQEFKVIQDKKRAERARQKALQAHAPKFPPLDAEIRTSILGRYMLHKYFEFPPFTHEEVDGYIYMKATALRALRGCPKSVQQFWQKRPWHFLRVYRLKSRPEPKYPWLTAYLPGGYFTISAKAIDTAGNEAELAFLLVRSLVSESLLKRKAPVFPKKNWAASLAAVSEEHWEQALFADKTKTGEAVDVAHDIEADVIATECMSRSGYRPIAGLSYLRKLSTKKEEKWASWFFEHSPGLEYRLDRAATLIEQALSKKSYPEGKASNIKRFATASRFWNLLP